MVLLAVLAVARAEALGRVELVALEQVVKEVMVATITRLHHITVAVVVVLHLLAVAAQIQTMVEQELQHLFLVQVLVTLVVVVLECVLVEQAVRQPKAVARALLLLLELLQHQIQAVAVAVLAMALSVMAVMEVLAASLFRIHPPTN
jgi:hypothetical protein